MTWLFLPEPKARSSQLHDAIQGVDLLSARFVHGWFSYNDNEKAQVCYAAVEVGNSDDRSDDGATRGRARESQLRHGVRQLQYALPALVSLRARWVASKPAEENFPFFFVPVLLTNAKLIVANHDFGIETVENAENLGNVGTTVPHLIWSAELGPDFDLHCQRQLANLGTLVKTKNIKVVEERREAAGLKAWLQPTAVAERLLYDGGAAGDLAEFTEVVVVNIEFLPNLIEIMRGAFEGLANSVKDKPVFRG
jgi:hypothetical protein